MQIDIKKILCPVDFSDGSNLALRYAIAFAQAYHAEVEIMHVVEMPFLPSYSTEGLPDFSLPIEQIQELCEERLSKLADKFDADGALVQRKVTLGSPFVEIIQEAKNGEFDLVVIGTHGETGLKHVLIGSTAEKVVRKAPCPVLSVKNPEHEFVMP
ncbi:MAG: universal stress protein [Candidatus Brocadiia bacterium]|nr:universal stress protein [Planctomycetota bacterium]